MKNNRETKNQNRLLPAFMLVVMALASSCAFAQSGGSNLLYSGYYTETEHVDSYGGKWPPFGGPNSFEVKIYEDRMEYWNVYTLKFKSMNNGKRIYSNGMTTAYVDGNYNISMKDDVFTGGYQTYQFVKNGTQTSTSKGGNYGGGTESNNRGNTVSGKSGNNGGSTQSSGPKTKDCPICHHSGKCNTCNGRHWYYGPTGNKITCPNCKPDGKCSYCSGTGIVTTH